MIMDAQTIKCVEELKEEIAVRLNILKHITDQYDDQPQVMPEHDLDIALTMYADHLIKNYNQWNKNAASSATAGQFGAIDGKYDVWFERGRKFIKVVKSSWGSRSVHSFICIQPHGKFQFGDILKAASWAAPAKNFARGNVLNPSSYFQHRWTGA
jgi:hypothetical protein